MIRRVTSLVVGAALAFMATSAHAQSGVTGDWDVTFESPQGPVTVTVSLKIDGDKANGELSTPIGKVPITGTATADGFNLTATLDLQGTPLPLGLTGKVNADALTGNIKAGDLGEFPFTGKRAVARAATSTTTPAPVSAAASGVAAGDASGTWNIVLDLGGNQLPITATLKQDGEKVSASLTGPAGEMAANGVMTGKSLKLEFTARTPQGDLPVTMTGDLTADGTFAGKASIGGMGEANWTGRRAN